MFELWSQTSTAKIQLHIQAARHLHGTRCGVTLLLKLKGNNKRGQERLPLRGPSCDNEPSEGSRKHRQEPPRLPALTAACLSSATERFDLNSYSSLCWDLTHIC
ncbi:hypothetical protein INR49_002183 [Caranx melampygus]|nr:hypothetical protein INR49_002183 [Caranx melampygus]